MTRGDIVLVNLPEVASAGREQTGSRPALIVHDSSTESTLSVIMIVPFTSNMTANRFPHTIIVHPSSQNGLDVDSILLVFQLRAIDKKRIYRVLGRLEDKTLSQVDEELKALLAACRRGG